MNRVNSRNGAMPWWQHHKYRHGIISIIIIDDFGHCCVNRLSSHWKPWNKKWKFRYRNHSSSCLSHAQMAWLLLTSWKVLLVSILHAITSWYRPRGPISLAGKETTGLVESNGGLPPGLWLMSPVGWLPRNWDGSVCASLCLYLNNISQKVLSRVLWNLVGLWTVAREESFKFWGWLNLNWPNGRAFCISATVYRIGTLGTTRWEQHMVLPSSECFWKYFFIKTR